MHSGDEVDATGELLPEERSAAQRPERSYRAWLRSMVALDAVMTGKAWWKSKEARAKLRTGKVAASGRTQAVTEEGGSWEVWREKQREHAKRSKNDGGPSIVDASKDCSGNDTNALS